MSPAHTLLAGARCSAEFSPCERLRWTLTRIWDAGRPLLLVAGFNPSTAGVEVNDPTILLTCLLADHNGYGGIVMVNLCPLRSSVPAPAIAMLKASQVDGDVAQRAVLWQNMEHVRQQLQRSAAVLLAWGAMGAHAGAWHQTLVQEVREFRPRRAVFRLGVCGNGHPKHPMARGKHKVPPNAPFLPWEAS